MTIGHHVLFTGLCYRSSHDLSAATTLTLERELKSVQELYELEPHNKCKTPYNASAVQPGKPFDFLFWKLSTVVVLCFFWFIGHFDKVVLIADWP